MIDSETSFVVSYNISSYPSSKAITAILYDDKKNHSKPNNIVSDRYKSYPVPIKMIFSNSYHLIVDFFADYISNNLIEAFFGIFKDRYMDIKVLKP